MPRKLSDSLMSKLLTGEYQEILRLVKNDPDLYIGIRIHSQAIVYYKKSKVLTLRSRSEPILLESGYYRNSEKPFLDLNNPGVYFGDCKAYVNMHAEVKGNIEFSNQQKIADDNDSLENPFLVLDMEYQFDQRQIKHRTTRKTRFDLIAIDHNKNEILLLEVKQGFTSSSGKSGVDDHIDRYGEHNKHDSFSLYLKRDISNVIIQKKELGIFDFNTDGILSRLNDADINMRIVFAYNTPEEMDRYKKRHGNDKQLLFVDKRKANYIIEYDV